MVTHVPAMYGAEYSAVPPRSPAEPASLAAFPKLPCLELGDLASRLASQLERPQPALGVAYA